VALTRTCFGYNAEAVYAHTSGVIDTNRELTIVMLILCVCADAVAAMCHIAIQVELSKAFSVFALLMI
jgi:phosphosulfolactate phosphohydrolase-like enzyme